nr:RNA polymerase sporulation sigma factor SigH [Candidatus Aquicultor secundus]
MQIQADISYFNAHVLLQTLTDSQLVIAAREGNDSALEFLLDKYKNFVRLKARAYFLIGADWDDLVQEGMIGLYKAIRDYREGRQASFRAFAELCITRQIITAIKTATRQKHRPLNSYVSLNRPVYFEDESDRMLMDLLSGAEIADPVELVISGEEIQSMQTSFGEILSDLEAQVLKLYIDGKSYQEIADELNRHVKSIDNALQRVKRKVELHLRRRQAIV